MAGLGTVGVAHAGWRAEFRPRWSSEQVFVSRNGSSCLGSERRRFRGGEEVTGSSGCRSFGSWCVSQRGRVNYGSLALRGGGFGSGDRSGRAVSGQCCVVSNFSSWRGRRSVGVRCEGESASAYHTVTYSEAGEGRGQGGGDGGEGESASPIVLENLPVNNGVDDGYAMIGIDEGLLKALLIEFMKL